MHVTPTEILLRITLRKEYIMRIMRHYAEKYSPDPYYSRLQAVR